MNDEEPQPLWEKFFDENDKPKNFEELKSKINLFCAHHEETRLRKIALVTSGGTTVPLEKNTVRFIDNFSAGTRGSASAEYFIEAGYAVIFLHRSSSLKPFVRHFSHENFLEMLELEGPEQDQSIRVQKDFHEIVARQLMAYEKAKNDNLLLMVPFTSLTEYLWLLRICSERLDALRKRVILYLAAAVSDFYIPSDEMAEHKIQSSEGAPTVNLHIVPKMLNPLVKFWVPSAFVVSFKLETDPSLLIPKSKKALQKYNHKLVIGNLLHTRKEEVLFVSKEEQQVVKMTEEELAEHKEIEEKIIGALAKAHEEFIRAGLAVSPEKILKT